VTTHSSGVDAEYERDSTARSASDLAAASTVSRTRASRGGEHLACQRSRTLGPCASPYPRRRTHEAEPPATQVQLQLA
jgi:hypothetical protein